MERVFGIEENAQFLMSNNLLLKSIVDSELFIKNYPFQMDDTNPLLLFNLVPNQSDYSFKECKLNFIIFYG